MLSATIFCWWWLYVSLHRNSVFNTISSITSFDDQKHSILKQFQTYRKVTRITQYTLHIYLIFP